MREYIIKIWEDEVMRDLGESDVVAIGLTDMQDTIKKAKHIMALHNYASLEVQTQDEKNTVFAITPEDGEKYFNIEIENIKIQDKINKYFETVYLNAEIEHDSDTMLGKAKHIINEIKNDPTYNANSIETVTLLLDLQTMTEDDVTKVFRYEESEYYEIKPPNEVLEDLQKSYLEHMKDVRLEYKDIQDMVEIYFDMNEITDLMEYGADRDSYTMTSLSDLFTEILEELDIPIDDVFTNDGMGDGKYEVTIVFEDGKEYSLDTKAWYTAKEVTEDIEGIREQYILNQEKEMQDKINKYFKSVYPGNICQSSEDEIFGKAKDVIKELKENQEYVNNPENKVDEETIEFINTETNDLLKDLEKKNDFDIVRLHNHPMAGFYCISDIKGTLKEIQDLYLEHMEDFNITHKNIPNIVEIYFDRNEIKNFKGYENSADIIENLFDEILKEIGVNYDDIIVVECRDSVTVISLEFAGKDSYIFEVKTSDTQKEITKDIEDIASHYQVLQLTSPEIE